MAENLKLELLTAEEVGNIHDKCLRHLSTKGVKVDHQEALRILDKAGARVDFDNQQVRFPKDVIEEALRTVPRDFRLAGHSECYDLALPHPDGLFYVRNNSGAQSYVGLDGNAYRNVTLADVAEWSQLAETLDEINICAHPVPNDAPEETADIHAVKTVFENTGKHLFLQVYGFKSIQYLFELALVVAGSKEALKKRPIVSTGPCSVSPFVLKAMDVEQIIYSSRYGVPMFLCPLPSSGATSPVTMPGTILQCSIEILAMLVMSQMLQPGTPVIAMPVLLTLDMLTGRLLGSSIDAVLGTAGGVQFIKDAYHIPTFTWGLRTDSYIPDEQAMLDKINSGLISSLAGCDILTTAGGLSASIAMSPVQLIIDNKLAKVLKQVKAGLKVDDDTLAWKEILDTEPGGHYLERAHTLKHCREALRTQLSVSQPRDTWRAEGSKDLYVRMVEEYRELKKNLKPLDLPEEVKRELNQIVKHADEHLVK